MSEIMYKKILKFVCKKFRVSKELILSRKKGKGYFISDTRQIFLKLCIEFGIDVYKLSILLGKSRTAVYRSIKDSKSNVNKTVKELYGNLVSSIY